MPNHLATYWRLHRIPIVLALVSFGLYYLFAHHLVRNDFIRFLTLYAALFFLAFKLYQFEKWNFKFLLVVGILFRFAFLWVAPNLSQDFYRFIWDGELVLQGLNPYLQSPDALMGPGEPPIANAQVLHDGMGPLSAKHYSNYPPLNQWLFALSVLIGGKSIVGAVITMRCMIIMADLGVFYFARKLLKKLNRPPQLVFLYFINPLVIVELTGNLHFEGVMLCLFVWAAYLLAQGKWSLAAPIYAASIAVKLVPLLFLPLLFRYLGVKRSLLFYGSVGLVLLLFALPFTAPGLVDNYLQTVGLWFSNFEFNAGIYNLVKNIAVRFDAKPWELIKNYGTIVKIIVVSVILLLALLKSNKRWQGVLLNMLWVLGLYYLLSATVHPWYVIFLVVLAMFTDYRWPLLWSALALLSYYAYSQPDFMEHMGLLAIEYMVVIGFLGYEIFKQALRNHQIFKK